MTTFEAARAIKAASDIMSNNDFAFLSVEAQRLVLNILDTAVEEVASAEYRKKMQEAIVNANT